MFSRSVVCWFVASAVAALAVAPEAAYSKPVVRTRYQYFTVSGISASALHQSLVQRGPTVNGDKAYAATETDKRSRPRGGRPARAVALGRDAPPSRRQPCSARPAGRAPEPG